jgi:hypothetical protein
MPAQPPLALVDKRPSPPNALATALLDGVGAGHWGDTQDVEGKMFVRESLDGHASRWHVAVQKLSLGLVLSGVWGCIEVAAPQAPVAGTGGTGRAGSPAKSEGAAGKGTKESAETMSPRNSGAAGASSQASGEPNRGAAGSGQSQSQTPSQPSAAGSGGGAPAAPAGPKVAACSGHANEFVCDKSVLIECGDGGTALGSPENCASAAQCRAGIAAGACGECDPGDFRCTEADLETCDDTGHWMLVETCPSVALCENGLSKHSCDPSKCAPGTFSCDGGALRKCMDDMTDFDQGVPCEKDLCDPMAGKCNECVPSSNECADPMTAVTCSAEGMKTVTACAAETPHCLEGGGKCVACTTDDHCMVASECRIPKCDMAEGTCGAGEAKPAHTDCNYLGSGSGKCDFTGNCVACVTDDDCEPSEECSPLVGCRNRSPLQLELGLLPGVYSVTVSPGFVVAIDIVDLPDGETITIRDDVFQTYCTGRKMCELDSMSEARRYTISGPNGSGCRTTGLTEVTRELALKFAAPATDTTAAGACGMPTVHMMAREKM